MLKHGVMLRMWLGHAAEPDRLRRMLEEHREQSEKMRIRAAADLAGALEEPGWAYPQLTLRWSERYYADERDRADQMLAELDETARQLGEDRRASTPAPGPPPSCASTAAESGPFGQGR